MNLIRDPWIPVRRANGREELIAPWQLTEGPDLPVALASARADFDGALIQFWIGLLQTAWPPDDPRSWRRQIDSPPSPQELRRAFEPLVQNFELLGEGARFLQDLELEEDSKGGLGISQLLINAPGGNTLKENKDHFVKRSAVEALCQPCAAAALLTLQINAPAGGQGHRTGLRGGGPLTTLVIPRQGTLWQTAWFNVLSAESAHAQDDEPPRSGAPVFPWLASTRTSQAQGGQVTTPEDVHPLQLYWAMPRRIRLTSPEAQEQGNCDVCGIACRGPVRSYSTKNLGINYLGAWVHPLSPYRKDKQEQRLPIHGSPRGVSYRNWLGWIAGDPENGTEPAAVVHRFQASPDHRRAGMNLWAFGYDMDNMKARAWNEGVLPLYLTSTERARESLEREVRCRVLAAVQAQQALSRAVKQAIARRPKDLKGDPVEVDLRFWEATQDIFYSALEGLAQAVEREDFDPMNHRQDWHRALRRITDQLFSDYLDLGYFQAVNPQQVVEAGIQLRKTLNGPKILGVLGLNKEPSVAKEVA